jgi:flagellar hook-length control protein FliK
MAPVHSAEQPRPSEDRRFTGTDLSPATSVSAVGSVGDNAQATVAAASQGLGHQTPLSVERVTPPPAHPVANPVERIVVQQVTRALVRRNENGDRSLVIRLTPPELGTVRVEITERDGQLTARLHADDPAVRQALDRLLPQVRSDLRSADSPLQQISLETSGNSGQAPDGRGFDGRGSPQQSPQQRSDQAGNNPRGRRGERAVFSLNGGVAPVEAEPQLVARQRVATGLVDTVA